MAKNKNLVAHSPILWIEGRWAGGPDFVSSLRNKGFSIEVTNTGKAAIQLAKEKDYDLLVVYAASMRTSGGRICKDFNSIFPKLPIILINDPSRIAKKVDDYIGYLLVMDFTTRKLVNRIMQLLPTSPKNEKKIGPLVVNTNRNQVTCNGKQSTLTPRLMNLLEAFIEKKGTVIPREDLFMEVWKTTYTADTRTLDVHVSWLRQAIEKDPRNPKIIKTVRGVGYMFDVS